MKKIKPYKKILYPLLIATFVGVAAYNKLDNNSHKSVKALPVATKTIPAAKNLNLDSISGQDIVDNLVLKYSKGVKKDTVFAIYNHPNTCCPGNVQPYLLSKITFNPHYVRSSKAISKNSHSDKFQVLYFNEAKENEKLERTIDRLKKVIDKMNGSHTSASVDTCCGSVYGLRNAKVNPK